MDRQEVTVLLKTIKLSYPYWYRELSKSDMQSLLLLYTEKFARESFEVVNKALLNLVDICKYAPSMSEIKQEIKDIKAAQVRKTAD